MGATPASATEIEPPAVRDIGVVTADAQAAVWTPEEPTPVDEEALQTGAQILEQPWEPTELRAFPADGEEGTANRAPAGVVAGAPGLGAMSYYSFQDFEVSDDTSVKVNVANGNLVIQSNDGEIAGPGISLHSERFYNGLTNHQGAFGGGWSSSLSSTDVGLTFTPTSATFHGPTGLEKTFAWTGSAYTPVPGLNATLTKLLPAAATAPGYVLRFNKTGEQITFSGNGHMISDHDRNGIGLAYVGGGDTIQVADAAGRSFEIFSYTNGADRMIREVNGFGRVTKYEQTGTQLTKVTKADGTVTTITYDTVGRVSSMTVPGAPASTHTISFGYDNAHRVTSVTEQAGTSGSTPSTITTSFTYTAGHTAVTDPNSHTAGFDYDTEGRVTQTTDALNRVRATTWTANSDIATSTDALGSGTTAGNVTTYSYDGDNNPTSAQLPTGAASSAIYALGTNCPNGNTGDAFQVKCSIDASGNKKDFQYDPAGNPTTVTDTTGSTGVVEQQMTYELPNRSVCGGFAGQICSSTDGNGNTTSYAYDSRGNVITVTPPAPLGATTSTYDTLSRITSVTDGNGATTTYAYDIRDRLRTTTYDTGNLVANSYYLNGLLSATEDGDYLDEFSYDRQGRVIRELDPTNVSHSFTYDAVGNMLTYANGDGTTTYSYDVANQLTSLKEPGGTCSSSTPAANSGCVKFEYDGNGSETKRTTPGGATIATTRDASTRPTRIEAKTGAGASVVDVGYSYTQGTTDRTNVQTRTSTKEQGITAGAVTAYTYDTRNRLTQAEEKSGTSVTAKWQYGYDNTGNRTTQTRSGSTGAVAGTIGFTYNAANQISSTTDDDTSWAYDAAGNQTRNGITDATSSFGDRLQASSIGPYAQRYAGQGNTHRMESGPVGSPTSSYTSSPLGLVKIVEGTTQYKFSRSSSGEAISYKTAGSNYYVKDHLGSTIGILSSTGTYQGGYSYSPYGEARSTSTNAAIVNNKLRYISGLRDTSTGLYKLGARYYDTSLGRFTQMDPSGQEANPYLYAAGDPINKADPSGLDAISTIVTIAEVVLAGGDVLEVLSGGDLISFAAGIAVEALCMAAVSAPTGGIGLAVSFGFCTLLAEVISAAVEQAVNEGLG